MVRPALPVLGGRGPTPTYCSRSHRQRAYQPRRRAGNTPEGLEQLAKTLHLTRSQVDSATTKAAVVAAYHHLAAAAGTVLGETLAPPGRQPVTVTASGGGSKELLPTASADPAFAAVTPCGASLPVRSRAAAELGATTTKTTATFIAHHAIQLEFIRTHAAR